MSNERIDATSAPTAVPAAVRPDVARKKDRTAAKRMRAYRARKRENAMVAALVTSNASPAAVTVTRVTRVTPVTPGNVTPRRHVAPLLATVLAVLAVVIADVGIAINGWFASSLGKTIEAAMLFVAIGIAADGLAFLLPTVALRLATARRYAGALVAWLLWMATMAFALLASAGFAGLNITDVTAGRARDALASQTLATRIERLQAERAVIQESRAVHAIAAEIQQAQARKRASLLNYCLMLVLGAAIPSNLVRSIFEMVSSRSVHRRPEC